MASTEPLLPLHKAEVPAAECTRRRRTISCAALAVVGTLLLALFGWRAGSVAMLGSVAGGNAIKFIAVGDWGREGGFNQSLVADAMAAKAAAMGGIDFVVSTGDNFYPSGVRSAGDSTFDASFKDMYHHQQLQVPWHAVLGNHDYGELKGDPPVGGWDGVLRDACGGPSESCYYSPLHELNAALPARDWRWHCERAFHLALAAPRSLAGRVAAAAALPGTGGGDAPLLELFFVDTTPMVSVYLDTNWSSNPGGVLEQSARAQLAELDARLAASRATWKLVVGHHPVRSNHRADVRELVPALEPLMERHGVQAYLCGHDHNLQLLRKGGSGPGGVHYVVTGAGSKVSDGNFNTANPAEFLHAGQGFVAAVLSARTGLALEFIGVESERPMFTMTLPPPA